MNQNESFVVSNWSPDDLTERCTSCGCQFWVFSRKHHCRDCGEIFCQACSSHEIALPPYRSFQNPVRVCQLCFQNRQNTHQDEDYQKLLFEVYKIWSSFQQKVSTITLAHKKILQPHLSIGKNQGPFPHISNSNQKNNNNNNNNHHHQNNQQRQRQPQSQPQSQPQQQTNINQNNSNYNTNQINFQNPSSTTTTSTPTISTSAHSLQIQDLHLNKKFHEEMEIFMRELSQVIPSLSIEESHKNISIDIEKENMSNFQKNEIKEIQIKERESKVEEINNFLSKREKYLDNKEKEIEKREKEIEKREKEIEKREKEVEEREREVKEKEKKIQTNNEFSDASDDLSALLQSKIGPSEPNLENNNNNFPDASDDLSALLQAKMGSSELQSENNDNSFPDASDDLSALLNEKLRSSDSNDNNNTLSSESNSDDLSELLNVKFGSSEYHNNINNDNSFPDASDDLSALLNEKLGTENQNQNQNQIQKSPTSKLKLKQQQQQQQQQKVVRGSQSRVGLQDLWSTLSNLENNSDFENGINNENNENNESNENENENENETLKNIQKRISKKIVYKFTEREREREREGEMIYGYGVKTETNKAGLKRAKKSVVKMGRQVFQNEDEYFCAYPFFENKNLGFFSIFDGHVDKNAAKVASQILPKAFFEEIGGNDWENNNNNYNYEEQWKKIYCSVDLELKEFEYEGTTVTTVLIWRQNYTSQKWIQVANVGDSNAYLIRRGKPVALTQEHRVNNPQEQERMREAGQEVAPHQTRINGLSVSRALGDHFVKENQVGLIPTPHVCEPIMLTEEDSFLILASDGLWDVTTAEEAFDTIKGLTDPHDMSKRLINEALKKPGCVDNITVVVVCL